MDSSQPAVAEVSDAAADARSEQTRGLLEEHVPLSLIMDLTAPQGPASREILAAEGAPEHAWWERD